MSEQIIAKQCSKCKQSKAFSEFYKDSTKKDNLRPDCKVCGSKSSKKYRQTTKYKVAQKHYRQSKKGKIAERRYRQSDKWKVTRKHYRQSDEGIVANKRFNAQHPEQIKARRAVNHAIESGKLPRPNTKLCHYCPKPAQQYHHWHGYEKEHWLDVIPVCTECHRKYDKKIA